MNVGSLCFVLPLSICNLGACNSHSREVIKNNRSSVVLALCTPNDRTKTGNTNQMLINYGISALDAYKIKQIAHIFNVTKYYIAFTMTSFFFFAFCNALPSDFVAADY